MDIHELKCFSQVAKDNSYSVAAAKLKLSQPALSKIIQRMESELGTELFYTFRRKQRLTDAGNTVLVIEHNLNVIKVADYLIDLGKEGGTAGGTLVVSGTPEEVAACADSYTGNYLKAYL